MVRSHISMIRLHPFNRSSTRSKNARKERSGKIYYPAPYLSNETLPYYTSAYDLDMRKVIDTYASAQQHVDQGMSLTLSLCVLRSQLDSMNGKMAELIR